MTDRDRDRDRNKVKHTYEGCFDENSPRPPVPGEERAHCTSDWTPQMEWGHHTPTPRKSYYSNDPYAPMGYEPEGSSKSHDRQGSRTPCDNPSPPACLRWSYSLHRLLEDSDGVQLFKRFLQLEGQPHADALDFWFACNGLRKQREPEQVQQLVKVIYRRFFRKSALPIPDELRKEVGRRVKSTPVPEPPVDLFDEAQAQVEHLISNTTYPNFLKSDMYLNYIQSIQNPIINSGDFSGSDSSSSSSAVSTRELSNLATGGGLPTLHEDMEFVTSSPAPLSHTPGTGCMSTGYHTPNVGGGPFRLTKDMLLATQRRRALDVRPKPEAYADKFLYRGVGAHAVYNSYNPVSRQESELQSLSSHSDARTESDNMSLTDNSVDGKSLYRTSRRHASMMSKQVQELASVNKETNMHETVIPRTQRMDSRQYHVTDPATFAPILIEMLEKVKREQESQELLNRKLMEGNSMSSLDEKARSTDLANAIREKLQLEDDNDQDILDQHVSRVFSDLTPARSPPGVTSPRPYSPSRNRYLQEPYLRRRKDKDGFSTFSSDSGNVHDFPELNMVKSKSMTEYNEERFVRGASSRRSSKKTLAELTDSGVSVVSDTPPVTHGVKENNRVLAWVMDSDRGGRGSTYTHSEMSGKHNRHRKAYSGSRSSSVERCSASGSLGPAQPFVADPSMPPLPIPNTAIQLEEARRRLEEDGVRITRFRQKSNKYFPDATQSSQSTLRKSTRSKLQNLHTPEDYTTVVFNFCDEQFPYRTKIPGRQVTLKQFKEYLPKKGTYRFFFKTECEELGNQVIQEEVSNDLDVVPLFEGKIMAQVKPID